jgi:hypothetical protein
MHVGVEEGDGNLNCRRMKKSGRDAFEGNAKI